MNGDLSLVRASLHVEVKQIQRREEQNESVVWCKCESL
ncbi:hypothetical protein LINPERHAP1_LOCUS38231 [Linum perenne]